MWLPGVMVAILDIRSECLQQFSIWCCLKSFKIAESDVVWRVSRLLPWLPSWILELNYFSNSDLNVTRWANKTKSANLVYLLFSVSRRSAFSELIYFHYSEPSLQWHHLFPKTLPLKWICCCKESLMSRLIHQKVLAVCSYFLIEHMFLIFVRIASLRQF